jgi:hypothetical protein
MPVFRQASDAAQGDVKLEAITQPLYDNQSIATGASSISFFAGSNGRSRLFTNVETANQLTWPKRFSVKAFRLVPAPDVLATNLLSFYVQGYSTLVVGEKKYFESPNFIITPGIGLEVALVTGAAAPTAPANGQNYGHNGRPDHRNLYVLQHSIWIPSVQNFRYQIDMSSTFTTSASISTWVFLEGEYFREIQ